MSKVAAGRYVIYSRALTPTGQKLALTFSGTQKEALTISPLANAPKQIWVVKDYNSTTSTIGPDTSNRDQVGNGGGVPVVLPPGGYTWTMQVVDSGYIIQDGGKSASSYWNVGDATDGTKVSFGQDNGILSRWVFEKA
ncbi:CCL1 lectin [Crepidotus variabilis]|uniref:CCL1 lectin n=1 Tax=Crepidotus variabilis TaxID=179855 RepID=A0A9P6ELX4_9AGAR|nr:CCL1 lectin [Crepidotus variabilis]